MNPAPAALFACLVVALANPAHGAATDQPIRVEGGLVEGTSTADHAIHIFKGIPFAAPPVGALRWRPPQPVQPWSGVKKTDAFGPSDIQTPRAKGSITYEQEQTISEDCLYLNIWTGAAAAGEKRPVLLYIHGGGFTIGEGTKPGYDGEGLARKGAVVVTINYRLNIFGFFAHPELSRESAHGVSGNYGMLDMIAAIKWARRNVAAFGGNPDRITIFGESAGSISVSALTSSPLIRGDIVGAIAQSIVNVKAPMLADLERKGGLFASASGAHSVADLRRMPAKQLFKEYLEHGTTVLWWPTVDGWVLKGDILSEEEKGDVPAIPILTGSNADEGVILNPAETAEGMTRRENELYGSAAAQFARLYPENSDTAAIGAQNIAARDKIAWEHQRWAEIRAKHGRRTYVYFFTHAPPLPVGVRYHSGKGRDLPEHLGAFHTADIHYIFSSLDKVDRPWKSYDRHLADVMSSYWVNFARNGDPNGAGLPRWPVFGSEAKPVIELGDEVRPIATVLPAPAYEFWTRNYARADCVWSLW